MHRERRRAPFTLNSGPEAAAMTSCPPNMMKIDAKRRSDGLTRRSRSDNTSVHTKNDGFTISTKFEFKYTNARFVSAMSVPEKKEMGAVSLKRPPHVHGPIESSSHQP